MSTFDPLEFAVLLKKLIGNRHVQDFAKEIGVARFNISRRLAASLPNPPRKKTLQTYAAHAQNGVTYEELLTCCGYEPEKTFSLANSVRGMKLAKVCLLTSVNDLGIPVRISGEETQVPCDFELVLGNDPEITWDFKYLPDEAPASAIEQIMDESFRNLMYKRLRTYSKLSFITGSPDVFTTCREIAPQNLNANVSAILFSGEIMGILKETELATSIVEPVPDQFTLPAGSDQR